MSLMSAGSRLGVVRQLFEGRRELQEEWLLRTAGKLSCRSAAFCGFRRERLLRPDHRLPLPKEGNA
jgi:hypothetical protein